jgi:hypothetical protein
MLPSFLDKCIHPHDGCSGVMSQCFLCENVAFINTCYQCLPMSICSAFFLFHAVNKALVSRLS